MTTNEVATKNIKQQKGGEDDEWIKHFGWTDPLNNPSTGLYRRLKQTRKNLFDL